MSLHVQMGRCYVGSQLLLCMHGLLDTTNTEVIEETAVMGAPSVLMLQVFLKQHEYD